VDASDSLAVDEPRARAPLPTSLWVLVAANVVPLLGVLLLGWDLGLILLLYWAESAVVLLFSLAKLAIAARRAALGLVPFFVLHAGIFMGGHLLFLVALFIERPAGGWGGLARDVALVLPVFAASHGYSFWSNVRRRGERQGKAQDVMGGFYGRIVVMHLTILLGGWLILLMGRPAGAVLVLVALKTGADVFAHLRERRRNAPAPGTPTTGPPAPS
jgi:hypothetical protein